MTPEQFCYWLQGFAELTQDAPTPEQWRAIREHVATVFKKVTPSIGMPDLLKELQRDAFRDQFSPPQPQWAPNDLSPGKFIC